MPKVVVIGQDTLLQRSIAALCEDTLHVLGTPSPRSGINAACALEPACVVIEHDPPAIDGLAVARALRDQPTSVASAPIVLLVPAQATSLRTEALVHGVDVCLIKPVRAADVLGQARALMAMARRMAGAASSRRSSVVAPSSEGRPRALVGSLARMPPTTVLAVLELEQRSGDLVLGGVPASRKRLVLELASGALVGGRIGSVSFGPVDAMREALRWPGLRFEFASGPSRPAPPNASRIGPLLIAAMRSEPEGDLAELNNPPPSLPQPLARAASEPPRRASSVPAPATGRGSGISFRQPTPRRRSQPPPRRSTLTSQQAVQPGAKPPPVRRLSEQVRAAIRVEEPFSTRSSAPPMSHPFFMRPDPRVEPDDDDVLEAENWAPDGADAPRTREAP
jgi:DNA-binding response OmpR family regulator